MFLSLFVTKPKFLLIGCLSMLSILSGAQDQSYEDEGEPVFNRKYIEFSIDRIRPIQTFGENIDETLTGFRFGYMWQMNKEKLDYVGFQINYAHVDSNTNSFFDSDVRTASNIIGVFVNYRHFPDFYFWKIEPFVEAVLGPQFFYTQTTTSFFDVNSTNDVVFDEVDTGIGFGAGVGFLLHITGQVFFTTQLNYIGGTSVTYLVETDAQNPFPIDNFRPETSQTNYIKLQFGISVSL